MGIVTVYYNLGARAKTSSDVIKNAFFIGKCYREIHKKRMLAKDDRFLSVTQQDRYGTDFLEQDFVPLIFTRKLLKRFTGMFISSQNRGSKLHHIQRFLPIPGLGQLLCHSSHSVQ